MNVMTYPHARIREEDNITTSASTVNLEKGKCMQKFLRVIDNLQREQQPELVFLENRTFSKWKNQQWQFMMSDSILTLQNFQEDFSISFSKEGFTYKGITFEGFLNFKI